MLNPTKQIELQAIEALFLYQLFFIQKKTPYYLCNKGFYFLECLVGVGT
jgi:hypothetical protein